MEQTIGKLRYEVLDETYRGRCLVKLLEPFVYSLHDGGFSLDVTVHADFVSDLTSIPWFLWPFFPPDGPYQKAAVPHDYLYKIGAPRWICDAVFRHIMEAIATSTFKRCLLFYGVRVGGWRPWRRHRKQLTISNEPTTR